MAEYWPELVVAVTEQSVESVSLLLRGLDLLVSKGRITPAEYKVLALPAERLRHCGMNAQQIVRFQSGQVRLSHEKIDLAYLLECVLQERRAELVLMGITVRRKLKPMDILIDPTLGFSLTQAMLDWSAPFGSRMDLHLDIGGTPPQARLWMKTYSDQPPTQSAVFQDGIHWLLLRQIAATDGGIEVERHAEPDGVVLTAVFKRTLAPAPSATTGSAAGAEWPDSVFKSIVGAHVLVVSQDPDLRLEVQHILQKLGVTTDGSDSMEQTRASLERQHPDLIVIDRTAPPQGLAALREELQYAHPSVPVVDIGPSGSTTPHGAAHPVVARDAIQPTLGSTVMFALSKVM